MFFLHSIAFSQGLEGVIVEEYYVSEAADNAGPLAPIPEGQTTYRVFLDLAEGYEAQIIFASSTSTDGNVLEFATTTSFWNSPFGANFGDALGVAVFGLGATPLDSYISMGSGSTNQLGIPKADDPDGSIIVGRLQNTPPDGIAITTADGLTAGTSASTGTLGLDLTALGPVGGNMVQTLDGSFFNLDGVSGPTADNRVLIGQFTTDGDFSFKINVQLLSPTGETERYTHTDGQLVDGTPTTIFPQLSYPIASIPGCTDDTACNFDPNATDDNGSCIVPTPDCEVCNDTNDGLDLVDSDSDGTCDAEDGCPDDADKVDPGVCGCGVADADSDSDGTLDCNDGCPDDANKIDPGVCGCGVADEDSNNNGTIDCEEVEGCTNNQAENYNPLATVDDGSCVFAEGVACDGLPGGLEGIVVEEYYTTSEADASDPFAPTPAGQTTYRVFADLAPGYELQIVFASSQDENGNVLEFSTSTSFWNSPFGSTFGDGLGVAVFGLGNTPIDSYLSMGSGAEGQLGVLKSEDPDGSIISGRLENVPNDGIALTTADGLIAGTSSSTGVLGLNVDALGAIGGNQVQTFDGSFFNLDGVSGPTAENKVLIGQFTTDGEFSFKINLQILTPMGGTEIYTHTDPNLNDGTETRVCSALQFPEPVDVEGCTDDTACNFNPEATIDDDSCIIPVENCSACNATNDGLDIIDTDGDGVCDADEVDGCTDLLACNYSDTATEDDGSCIVPVENCTECNATNDGLDIIDTDGDGVCDADEVDGCTDLLACNYDDTATEDDGTCIVPVADCSECNATNDGLDLIDADTDGICDLDDPCPALPNLMNGDACTTTGGAAGTVVDCQCVMDVISGCTSSTACNYNELANEDDGSCIEPVENCLACNDTNDGLDLIDTDGDGVCDADEVEGCTDMLACNYDDLATEDNGSCIVPVEDCTTCNSANDGLELIDADNDGICDADDDCPLLADLVNGDPCTLDGGAQGTVADCECVLDIVEGCTSLTACNYNEDANQDDGSCIEPVADCSECNATNDGLDIIDTDGDGVCDADEVLGCTDDTACNFNPDATEPAPEQCIEAIPNCTECDGQGGFELIDTDGDGICDADEIPGCTSETACNYDENATDDNGSCVEPVENCVACGMNGEIIFIDSDGDGICNADEVPGCTDVTACNFNPDATDENGSCLEPIEGCTECNSAGGVDLIDTDNDGICDLEDSCPELEGEVGDPCDDGNADTYDDEITADCECAGIEIPCTTEMATIEFEGGAESVTVCIDDNIPSLVDVNVVVEPSGTNSTVWVITDPDLNVLGLPATLEDVESVNFDGAGTGNCLIWLLDFDPEESNALELAEDFMNEIPVNGADLEGCFSLSNSIEVVRVECEPVCSVEAGVISYGDGSESQTICADDMEPSFVELAVVEAPSEGNSTAWVVTDTELNILAVGSQEDIEAIDFDNAGPGVCLIWLLDYDAENSNVGEVLESDMPNAGDIEGCFALSNSIEIVREECGPVYDCPELEANIGDPCDDGDDMTGNDMINADCECVGEPIVPSDCEDWVMYLNDNDGGETDLYGVELVGGNAELTFLTTIGYQGHIAYNETDNMVYVISNVDASYVKVNPHVSPVEVSEVMYLSEDVPSVTTAVFSPDGALLIGSATQDMIYSVDVLTNNVTVYDAYAPVNGGDIAFDDSGMLYLATRQGNGLYEVYPDGVWDDVLIGSLSNLVTGMALTQDGRLLTSHNGNANLEVRNTDGSNPGDTYALMLDGEAFDHNNGDMASGCNTFSDENEGDCENFDTFYSHYGSGTGVSGADIYHVMYSGNEAVLTFLTNVPFGAHIAYNAEDDILYLVNPNGSFVRAYDPTLGVFIGDLPILGGINSLYAVVYNPIDGLLYVGDDNDNEIYTIDLGTGQATYFADAPVSGGDLAIQDGKLYLANRNQGKLYEIVGGAAVFAADIPAANGMAQANNSTGLVLAHPGTASFIEVDAADGSEVTVYTAMVDGEALTLSDGDMAAGCGDDEPVIVPEGECYAVATEEYVEGTQLDNSPLLAERADPNNALGAPEGIDALVFTTLGYGGSITVSFDGSVPNGEGDDIEVVETSYNNPGCAAYPEYATVEVSMDGVNWATAGTVCKGDPYVDISDAGDYEYVMYVRVTNENDQSTSSDGFDVDGIVALHNCEENGDGGEGVEDLLSVDSQNQLTSFPNPTNGPSQVVFVTAETGRTLVEVYDMNGRMVEALFNQEAEAGVEYRLDFNGNNLPNGVYIYRMTTENEVVIDKFIMSK